MDHEAMDHEAMGVMVQGRGPLGHAISSRGW
jgi:hypothetical protein